MDNNLNDEQAKLLRRNLEISEELLKKTEEIKSYIKWQKFFGLVNFLMIAIPIIIGIIYLPPLIKDYLNQFISLYK